MPSLISRKAFGLLTAASALMSTAHAETPTSQLCGQFQAVSNKAQNLIFNNNAWGDDGSGAQCTDVFNDGTSFATTWAWKNNGNDTHSFPNVQVSNSAFFPLVMSNLTAMNLQASWTMAPVDGATRANVVYDMFVDPDKTVAIGSNSTTESKYEIMIWIGAFGDPFPLGATADPFQGTRNASLPTVKLGDVSFTLYSGENDGGQTVHSWLSEDNVTDFDEDAKPLIDYLTTNNLVESNAFMGIFQFGSETWHSTSNVTFNVSNFNINLTSTESTQGKSGSSSTSSTSSSSTPTSSSSTSGASTTTASSSSPSGTPSGTTTTSSSSSSSSSTGSSAASIISLPFWVWEVAAAGALFAML